MSIPQLPSWNGTAKDMGEVWTLHEGSRMATCRLSTHPIGGEARVEVDGEMHRTQAGRAWQPLIDLALEWKAQFERKGRRRSKQYAAECQVLRPSVPRFVVPVLPVHSSAFLQPCAPLIHLGPVAGDASKGRRAC